MDPRTLPIYEIAPAIVSTLRAANRLVLQAPTGSGKSTQVPQILRDSGLLGDREIVVLQPRRIAARLLARRVAQERGVALGGEVGYQVRHESEVSRATRIRYVTEGLLLRQALSDPTLNGVGAILFDEFHERHLYADVSLALALHLQESLRPDLKLLVMSATLNAGALKDWLAPCEILTSQGRTFPVQVEYAERRHDFTREPMWNAAADALRRAVEGGAEGDALIFMPGAYEIARTVEAVRAVMGSRDCLVLPLHGELPARDQDLAVAPSPVRKVIVATNVAETSVTIDGVRLVIDAGLARVARFEAARGVDSLSVEPISRASADQRAGRAGRTAPGRCLRLWTTHEHDKKAAQEEPEIKRVDLAEIALTLKASGFTDLHAFRWLEKPDPSALRRAETLLEDLGATGHDGRVTELGRRMLSFPAHPRHARMLLEAGRRDCVRQAALIAALAQGRSILIRQAGRDAAGTREELLGEHPGSDFFQLMRAFEYARKVNFHPDRCQELGIHGASARQAGLVFDQFLRIAADQGLPVRNAPADDEQVQRCVLAGFSDQLAVRRDTSSLRCAVVHNRSGELAKESAVRDARLLVAAEVREIERLGAKDTKVTLHLATAVEEEWLRDLFPEDFREEQTVVYDPAQKRAVAESLRCFRDLVLERGSSVKVNPDLAARVLAEQVERGECVIEDWNERVDNFILRVNFLSAACPEWEIPVIGEAERKTLVEHICHGCTTRKDVKEAAAWPVVSGWLTHAQREMVDRHAPERLPLPNGKTAKIHYPADGTRPDFGATIQALYGMKETPRIANGRVSLRVQILAPSQRPVQVTDDLASFWKDRYPIVKQELQRKYPRHEWR